MQFSYYLPALKAGYTNCSVMFLAKMTRPPNSPNPNLMRHARASPINPHDSNDAPPNTLVLETTGTTPEDNVSTSESSLIQDEASMDYNLSGTSHGCSIRLGSGEFCGRIDSSKTLCHIQKIAQ